MATLATFSNQNVPKKSHKYHCDLCDYNTQSVKDYMKHIHTIKHKNNELATNNEHFVPKNPSLQLSCANCNKTYKDKTGLWRHKKKCVLPAPSQEHIPLHDDMQLPNISTTLIFELIKQNQELKNLLIQQSNQMMEQSNQMMEQNNQMMEQNKTIIEVAKNSNVNNTINNTNSNNKTFNLQFFLNETCKNAMNMSEFIETIEVQMNELENIGHNGYVAGMTDIILSRIKDLDVSKRPVHCTDLKRETMYIKDQNEWNKDNAEKSYLRKAISMVSKKNYGKTMEWRERNPECLEIGSPKYDFCFKMMRNVLGDFEDVQFKMDNKIIKSLAKEVVVDR
jgi:hypothetical protein